MVDVPAADEPADRVATVVRTSGDRALAFPFTVLPRRRFTVAPPITGAFGIECDPWPRRAVAVPIIAERAILRQPWNIGHATKRDVS